MTCLLCNSTLYMNAVFWLVDKSGIFCQFFVFSALSPSQGYLSLGIPYSVVFSKANTTVLGKYPARGKIPSLNSLWRHRCNSELLTFLLSTNAKVKKSDRRQCRPLCLKISDLFALYFFACCILQQNGDLFYFRFCSCFPRLIKLLEIKWRRWSEVLNLACMPLFFWLLNIRQN